MASDGQNDDLREWGWTSTYSVPEPWISSGHVCAMIYDNSGKGINSAPKESAKESAPKMEALLRPIYEPVGYPCAMTFDRGGLGISTAPRDESMSRHKDLSNYYCKTGLKAEFIRFVPSNDGVQADLFLIEPTGERLQVRCLCRHNGQVDIGVTGGPQPLQRLVKSYSQDVVVGVSKHVTLWR